MQIVLHSTRDEANDIRTFLFKPARPLQYIAGQYVEVTLPHDNPDDRGNKRWFTLSSAPSDNMLAITTRHFTRSSTFKDALFALQPGDSLQISEPMGDFVLPKDTNRPLIFIAGGIGVTPFHSIFRELIANSEDRTIRFLYAVAAENEIIFQDTFAAAKMHATIVVENPSPEWGGERGRLDATKIIGLETPLPKSLLYLSGPESMIEALASQLEHHGIAKDQIVTDTFPGYTKF